MKRYLAQQRGRFYAAIYQGRDPITGKEVRHWHPAGTNRGYERNIELDILPTLGRIGMRRLRRPQIESLYDTLLHPADGRGLAPKTVYEAFRRIVHNAEVPPIRFHDLRHTHGSLLMGLPRESVTSDLWCREVPLEGCSPCPSPIPVSSVRT